MSRDRLLRTYLVSYLAIFVSLLSVFSKLKEFVKSEFVQGMIFGILVFLIVASLFIDILSYLKRGRRYEGI